MRDTKRGGKGKKEEEMEGKRKKTWTLGTLGYLKYFNENILKFSSTFKL